MLGILGLAASVLAGYGIANEKRWGYFLAVAITGLEVLLYVVAAGGIIDAISLAGPHPAGLHRRPLRAAPAPAEPRLPAHLVQVAAA